MTLSAKRDPRREPHPFRSRSKATRPTSAESSSVGGAAERPPTADPQVVAFEDLAEGQRMVLIRHQGEEYRLSLTKSGKLVLTK